eukprot:gene28201-37105_t
MSSSALYATAAANNILHKESVGNLFLLEVEASIVSAMLALTSFIRQITPEPIDSNALHYTVGSKVFYLSDRFLDIAQHPSNLLDSYVPVSSVKYTSAPLLTFWSYADLFHNASRNAHQDSDGPCLSTAHLLRCLRVTLSPTTALRLCRTYATTSADNKEEASGKNKTNRRGSLDENGLGLGLGFAGPAQGLNLHLLSGQLAFLINIAHHAHAPLGRESSMIHQLTEVRRLIRMRGDSSLGSGAMSISRVPALFRQSSRLTSPSSTLSHSGNSSAVAGGGGGGGSGPTAAITAAHPSHRWMDGSEWLAYVDWIDKWCDDLIFRLGGATLGQPEATQIMSPPEITTPGGQRKKRMGLRSKVDWVQSPEDL